MKHPTNCKLAALLREHADRIENEEQPMTDCSVNLDLARDHEHPPFERNVDPRAPELFQAKPTGRFVN